MLAKMCQLGRTAWVAATLALMSIAGTAIAGHVEGRYTFYSDPLTIAGNKAALLPGQLADYANITNKMSGLGGIAVDIVGLGGPLDHSDFIFRAGNSMSPSLWEPVSEAPTVSVLASGGAAGSDRVAVAFGTDVVRDRWLEITVRANEATGLSSPDVFYFGNLAGDVTGDLFVTPIDVLTVVNFLNANGAQFVGVDSPLDVTGDGHVSPLDSLLINDELNAVGPKSLVVVPEPTTLGLLAMGGLAMLRASRRLMV
ncbi:MAG: dockerin type I domain-containing protein [Planctomycetota bacterium]